MKRNFSRFSLKESQITLPSQWVWSFTNYIEGNLTVGSKLIASYVFAMKHDRKFTVWPHILLVILRFPYTHVGQWRCWIQWHFDVSDLQLSFVLLRYIYALALLENMTRFLLLIFDKYDEHTRPESGSTQIWSVYFSFYMPLSLIIYIQRCLTFLPIGEWSFGPIMHIGIHSDECAF
jgi:hypothetical protein